MADGSFWKTAPGVLTAVAAVITAAGGLIAILFQAGIIGAADNDGTPSPTTPHSQVVASAETSSTSTTSGNPQAGKAWKDTEAVITAKDGTRTQMRAETVRFCISAGEGINLNDSQDIAFEKMSSIEVLRSDVALSPGGTATVRVTLASGSTMEGTITSGCDFFSQAEAGRYSLYPDRLAKIDFLR